MLALWVFSRRERGSGCSVFSWALYYQEGNGLSLKMGPGWEAERKEGTQRENAKRTMKAQEADRKVRNWGQLPEGWETSGKVGFGPREEPELLEALLGPRIWRCCPFQDFGSARIPVQRPPQLAERALLHLPLLA